MPPELPSHELICRLLTYDHITGKLYWLPRTPDMFSEGTGHHSRQHSCDTWNTKNAFQEAGTTGMHGYRQLHLADGVRLRTHRVIWFMMTKEWPDIIDHINGIEGDNRWENLRNVTYLDNAKNSKRPRNNTSGVTGVSFRKAAGTWQAYGTVDHKRITIGTFPTIEQAVAARTAWAEAAGFHPNHGRH